MDEAGIHRRRGHDGSDSVRSDQVVAIEVGRDVASHFIPACTSFSLAVLQAAASRSGTAGVAVAARRAIILQTHILGRSPRPPSA